MRIGRDCGHSKNTGNNWYRACLLPKEFLVCKTVGVLHSSYVSHGRVICVVHMHVPDDLLAHAVLFCTQGLGDKPNETSSARSRRSGHAGSRMGSSMRGGSASR